MTPQFKPVEKTKWKDSIQSVSLRIYLSLLYYLPLICLFVFHKWLIPPPCLSLLFVYTHTHTHTHNTQKKFSNIQKKKVWGRDNKKVKIIKKKKKFSQIPNTLTKFYIDKSTSHVLYYGNMYGHTYGYMQVQCIPYTRAISKAWYIYSPRQQLYNMKRIHTPYVCVCVWGCYLRRCCDILRCNQRK